MLLNTESHATKLRDALGELGVHLDNTECGSVIAKLAPYPDWNSQAAKSFDKHPVAEQSQQSLTKTSKERNSLWTKNLLLKQNVAMQSSTVGLKKIHRRLH